MTAMLHILTDNHLSSVPKDDLIGAILVTDKFVACGNEYNWYSSDSCPGGISPARTSMMTMMLVMSLVRSFVTFSTTLKRRTVKNAIRTTRAAGHMIGHSPGASLSKPIIWGFENRDR